MRRRLYLPFILFILVCLLSGCAAVGDFFGNSGGEDTTGSTSITGTGGLQTTIGVPEEDLDFGLEQETVPTFGDVEDSEQATEEEDVLYTEQDGYLYRLDPATLEPVGEPLDPETKQPISTSATDETLEEQPIVSVPSDTVENTEEEYSPSQEAPTNENVYPNTGIFLEDD